MKFLLSQESKLQFRTAHQPSHTNGYEEVYPDGKCLFLMAQAVDGLDGGPILFVYLPDGLHVYVAVGETFSVNCFDRNSSSGCIRACIIMDGKYDWHGLDELWM